MFKKRALAMVLAFAFIIGCIPNVGINDVFAAATENPSLLQDGTLSTGLNNDNPVYSDGQVQNAFMFSWNLLDGESQTLEYWVKPKVKMVVKTTKTGEDSTVEITLLDENGAPIQVTDKKYTIYNNFAKQNLSADNYFDAAGNPSTAYNDYEDKAVVDTHTAIGSGLSTSAAFELINKSTDVGYSIMYNDFDLQFLLKQDGTFYFFQNGGFNTGLIYNTVFTNKDMNNNVTVFNRAFSIGLNFAKVATKPFVDVDGANTATSLEYEYEKYVIEDRGLVSVDADDKVGFDYTIEMPYEYNTANHTFTSLTTKEAIYNLVFYKGNTSSSSSTGEYISVTITVPPNGGTPVVTSKKFEKGDVGACTVDAATNTLNISFKGLDSGMLLTPVITYSLADTARAVIKEYGEVTIKAYTFPQYEIINNDGTDYISITPFKGYAGDYVLYSATTKDPINKSNFKYAARFFKESATSTDKIWLPLSPIPSLGEVNYDYKLFFNPNTRFTSPSTIVDNQTLYDNTVKTRFFQYTAKDRGTIGFPNDFTATNLNQSKMFKKDTNYTPDGSGNYVEDFQDVSYTLAWDLGKVSSIDKMITSGSAVIPYDIRIGNKVDQVDSEFATISFTITNSGVSGGAKLTDYSEIFAKNGTSPKDPLNNVTGARLVTVYSQQSSAYVYRLEVDFENVALDTIKKADYAAMSNQLFFEYPNIYFFTVSLSNSSDSVISTVKSITLNKDTAVELREPIKVVVDNMVTQFIGDVDELGQIIAKDQVSLDITYEQQQATLEEYMNYYFTNYDLTNYGQNMHFTNDIYISQDYEMMSKKLPSLSKKDRDAAGISTEFIFDGYKNAAGDYAVMMRQFSKNPTGLDPAPLKDSTGKTGIEVLRDGGVVRITDVPMMVNNGSTFTLPASNVINTLQVNGLDTNAKYYFYVDTSVVYESNDHKREFGFGTGNYLDHNSGVSALTSGTTGSTMDTPNILDEVPPKPEISLVKVGRNNYETTWDKVDMVISDKTRYKQEFRYEVLRIRDTKLADKYLDSRQDMQEVFKNQIDSTIKDKSAQLLYRNASGQPDVLLYDLLDADKDGITNEYVHNYDAGLYTQAYDNNNRIVYDDNSLAANKVYFIYARTVRVITEIDPDTQAVLGTYEVYSTWDVISATTVLGDAPIDLKVLYNYASTYNPQTQIPLSFRAKVPQLDTIGSDITFQVTYQYDGKEYVTPITIDSATLISSATPQDAEGYRTFTFLLSNLIPGKSYNIKVRQANSDGSFTNYSNTVQWKTEIDEDEYDKNDEVGAFEDLMDERVDSLIDGSQVVLENNSSEKVIMINGNNLANEITNSKANTITINTLEKGKDNTILIPFESYETANSKGMAWQFTNGDMYFNYSAKTIDPTYNANVIALNKKIERDVVSDYYMEFVFDYQASPTKLAGDERLTDVVKLSNVLKATNENVIDFQEAALKEALEEVKNLPQVLARKQAVLDKIKAGMYAEDAIGLVDSYVNYVEGLLQDNLNARLNKIKQTRDDQTVAKLDKNIIMGTNYQNVLSKVTAYSLNGQVALPMTTTRTTNATTTTVKDYGTYGFGGNVVNISGTIPNQSGNKASEIIAVNDLEDTMSSTGAVVNTSADMSVSQALTAMSNMTGMTDAEVKSLLNQKGVTINRNNESKNLTKDLGVTMVAVMYEQINGVNPDKIAIKDYTFNNKVKSSGTNSAYVKHIQLAKEVGIITSVPSTSSTMTVGEFLGMLSKI